MGRMAALYTLDIGSGIGGICGPLPERMAPGVVSEPADFFDDFFVVCYLWSRFAGDGYAVGGGLFNRGPDEGNGRELASQTDLNFSCAMKIARKNCNEHNLRLKKNLARAFGIA
jgi:hypothetical protein